MPQLYVRLRWGCKGLVGRWDRILVGDGGRFTVWPDVIGILRDRVGDHPERADSEPTACGPLDVFHRA
jgi:hypothetical protein